jgi:hypothetical protein
VFECVIFESVKYGRLVYVSQSDFDAVPPVSHWVTVEHHLVLLSRVEERTADANTTCIPSPSLTQPGITGHALFSYSLTETTLPQFPCLYGGLEAYQSVSNV